MKIALSRLMNGLKNRLRGFWEFIRDLFQKFNQDDPMSYSGSIAFYTLFSLPAILIIVVTIAGMVFGTEAVQGEIVAQFDSLIGRQSAKAMEKVIANAAVSGNSPIAISVGVATLLFGATTVFISMQNGLNHVFEVRATSKKSGLWILLIRRLMSFAMVMSLGFVLLVSLIVDAVIGFFNRQLANMFPDIAVFAGTVFNVLTSLVVVAIVFALIFRVLPEVRLRWRQVRDGAIFTSILFFIGKYLIGFYLGTSDFGTTYGAAGALVVTLIWVYYSSTILLLGAEYIYVQAVRKGQDLKPVRFAEKYEMKVAD